MQKQLNMLRISSALVNRLARPCGNTNPVLSDYSLLRSLVGAFHRLGSTSQVSFSLGEFCMCVLL